MSNETYTFWVPVSITQDDIDDIIQLGWNAAGDWLQECDPTGDAHSTRAGWYFLADDAEDTITNETTITYRRFVSLLNVLLAKHYPLSYDPVYSSAVDANDAIRLIQVALYGDVVFGEENEHVVRRLS